MVAVAQDLLDQIAASIADLYREVENSLVTVIADELKKGLDAPTAEVKLGAVTRLRAAAEAVQSRLNKTKSAAVREAIRTAYRSGWTSALTSIPTDALTKIQAKEALDQVPNVAVVENIAAALHRDLGRVEGNLLRDVDDAYRRVQAATAARIATGTATRRQASQAAWSRLIAQGITGFTDSAGRRWRLSSYAEMIGRTNIQRAAVQGQMDRLEGAGIDLVYISDNVQECKICRPFESKVLRRDAGPTGRIQVEHGTRDGEMVTVDVVDTLDGARARGLFHPNCRHSASAYLPGITRLKKATADPEGDVARQRQRALERKIRAEKEQQLGALTPEAKKQAGAKVRAAQAALRAHLAAHPDLKRLPYREQLGAGNTPGPGGPTGGPVSDQPTPGALTPAPTKPKKAPAKKAVPDPALKAVEEQAKAAAEAAEKARLKAAKAEADRLAKEAAEKEAAEKAEQEAKEATEKAKAPAKTSDVERGDFSKLRRVGPQGGSNPGGMYEDETGARWYVKTQQSREHAANEIAASRLYEAAGVRAAEIHHGRGAPGLPDGPQTASRVIAGKEASAEQLREPAREGFAADAWLANWDVAGLSNDNMLLLDDGGVARIDTGGALLFRAQGEPKGSKFGDKVNEWLSLRDREQAPQAARLFGGLTPAEQRRAIKQVEQVTPDEIRRIVHASGLPDHVADTLIARRKDLLDRLPALQRAADRQDAYEKAVKKAAKGADALAAAPRRLTPRYPYKLEPAPPWDDDDIRESEQALDWYRNSGYHDINRWLRADDPDHPQVQAIDRAMDGIQEDAVLYRGIEQPSTVFGPAWNHADISGTEWKEKAYGSSSADPRVAEDFAQDGKPPLIMRILASRGSRVVRLSDMAPSDRRPNGIEEEAELLNSRGNRYRVVVDHGYDDEGVRRIDVEVVT